MRRSRTTRWHRMRTCETGAIQTGELQPWPKGRRVKIRFLTVAGVCAVGALVLTGCDSKVGTAAVVNGHKISETSVNNYLTPAAKPLQSQTGASVAPRTFVLQYLIRNQVFIRALGYAKVDVTDDLLDGSKAAALSGSTEADLTKQVTGVGLDSTFEPVALRYQELLSLVGTTYKANADQGKAANAALAKAAGDIVINPRYGSWDASTISLTDLSKTQLPSFLQFDNALPGDAPPAQ